MKAEDGFFLSLFLSFCLYLDRQIRRTRRAASLGLQNKGKKKPALLLFMNGLAAQHPALPYLLYLVVLLALICFSLVLREARVTASWLSSLEEHPALKDLSWYS